MPLMLDPRGLGLEQLALVLTLLATTEIGYRLGRRRARHADDAWRSQVTGVQASTLGLLALLLGFSLSMAESRFTDRRKLIVEEANAIGTTYLRAGFLPEPERSEVKALLRRYVRVRRAYFDSRSLREVDAREAEAAELQRAIWARSERVVNVHPDWDLLGAYIESLNDTIDLDATRRAALEAHVPETMVLLILVVAFVACGATGLACGLGIARREMLSLVIVPLLVAVSCAVLIDLDRPRFGTIRLSDSAMDRLEESLRVTP